MTPSFSFLDSVRLHLFRGVAAAKPLSAKNKVSSKTRSAKPSPKALSRLDCSDNLRLRRSPFDQALERVRMQPNIHGSGT
jgi:hypothetical protein